MSTFSVSRKPISTRISLFESLDTPLRNLIALTPNLVFFLLATRTPTVASSFSSDGANSSANFLPLLSLGDLYSDYVQVNISLNNPSSLSFFNVYDPPIRSSLTDSRTDSLSSVLHSSRNLFILGNFNCHYPSGIQKDFCPP